MFLQLFILDEAFVTNTAREMRILCMYLLMFTKIRTFLVARIAITTNEHGARPRIRIAKYVAKETAFSRRNHFVLGPTRPSIMLLTKKNFIANPFRKGGNFIVNFLIHIVTVYVFTVLRIATVVIIIIPKYIIADYFFQFCRAYDGFSTAATAALHFIGGGGNNVFYRAWISILIAYTTHVFTVATVAIVLATTISSTFSLGNVFDVVQVTVVDFLNVAVMHVTDVDIAIVVDVGVADVNIAVVDVGLVCVAFIADVDVAIVDVAVVVIAVVDVVVVYVSVSKIAVITDNKVAIFAIDGVAEDNAIIVVVVPFFTFVVFIFVEISIVPTAYLIIVIRFFIISSFNTVTTVVVFTCGDHFIAITTTASIESIFAALFFNSTDNIIIFATIFGFYLLAICLDAIHLTTLAIFFNGICKVLTIYHITKTNFHFSIRVTFTYTDIIRNFRIISNV